MARTCASLTPEAIRADLGKIVAEAKQDAPEGRNQSLFASLEFSRRHLSPAARAALPWLGLFRGGVFEINLLDVSQLDPAAWESIRRELQAIALVRPEDDIQITGRLFLRFHPTLASAAADAALAQQPETRRRFIDVYYALKRALDQALNGSQSRTALAILDREEANYRTAVHWALADRQFRAAAALGDTFRDYLQMSGRLRERDAWVQWLKDVVTQQGFTREAATYERQHAYTRFTQGDPQGAVEQLQALIERLRHTTEFDPAFQLALAIGDLGRILYLSGAPTQAIRILRESIGLWEALVEKTGGQPWETLLSMPDHAKAAAELGNLSATMGDLANALREAGQYDEALVVAEKVLGIQQTLGNQREVATGHIQCAQILMAAGRYDEADARYDLALAAARQAGDKEQEGTTLQHQGFLADNRNQLGRAIRLYQQALRLFQEAGDQGSMMRTYNLFGEVERKAGRLAEARAWYEKSRELAGQLKDQVGLGQAAQNLGIVCQIEGDAARERGDEPAARRHYEAARQSVEESLRIRQSLGNKPDEAGSLSQLARIHLRLGDLAAAAHHAHAARQIRESLGLLDVWRNYDTLSEIAQARGDAAAASESAQNARCRARRSQTPRPRSGQVGCSASTESPCQNDWCSQSTLQTGFGDGSFPAFAVGQLPPIPHGLPAELRQWLEELTQPIRDAPRG